MMTPLLLGQQENAQRLEAFDQLLQHRQTGDHTHVTLLLLLCNQRGYQRRDSHHLALLEFGLPF